MSETLFFSFIYLSAAVLVIWAFFMRFIERGKNTQRNTAEDCPTALIVPVKGMNSTLETNLRSLLSQEGVNYSVYLVIEDESDECFSLLCALGNEFKNLTIVTAGKSVKCSQKNHNLISGVEKAGDVNVLVFCDSGHIAPPDWLESLISPLIGNDDKIISSGYHHVQIQGDSLVEYGRAVCVLGLRQVRMVPGFEQPWGGATAMTRSTYNSLQIEELWSSRVVDDVTLAKHLNRNNYRTIIPPKCDLQTHIRDTSWSGWMTWLTRQWAYLKFVFPFTWFFLGVSGILFTAALCICLILITAAPVLNFSGVFIAKAVTPLLIVCIAGITLRRSHPQPGTFLQWTPALFAALIMAGICHGQTWFSNSITWSGITYKVKKDGIVSFITRSDTK